MKYTDYRIVSKPDYIEFECPHCGEDVKISVRDLDGESPWYLTECTCPECKKTVLMGDNEYD